MKLKSGQRYTTRDNRTVTVESTITGSYFDEQTKRYFTADGGCIAYYRGNDPVIDDHKSIVMPPDPEADIVNEIHADEERARDPHTWVNLPPDESPGLLLAHAWCSECGALRTITTRGTTSATQINLPREYHTCGTNKSKKPARTTL